MKKVVALSFGWMLLLLGCETEPRLFVGPYHVRFTESLLTRKESFSQTVSIQAHLVAPALQDDLTIFYEIGGSARENIDYKIISSRGVIKIEKGKYFGTIDVQLINNANNILRSQDILFTLLSTNATVQVGQNDGGIGKKFLLTIEDDCILGGSYQGKRGGLSVPVSITSQDCEKYEVSNWNINLFTTTSAMDLTFVDNGDNTITIPEQEEENLSEEVATLKGTGVVDPVTGSIILNITLVDFEDQPTVTITYNRN